jgi:hypothetical protein
MDQLPKIVQHGLGRTEKPAVHPDPDLLTAFAEKSLNERERSHVLQHLAECTGCRDVLALAMPERESEALPSWEKSSWLSWPVMRWGALAACVVVVGAAITLHYDRQTSPAAKSDAAPTAVLENNAPKQPGPELAAKIAPPPPLVPHRDLAGVAGNFARQTEKKSLNSAVAPGRIASSTGSARDASADQPAAPAPVPTTKPAEPEQLAKTRKDELDYSARTSNQTVTVEGGAVSPMEQKTAISELKAKDESNKNEFHKEAQTAGAVAGAMQDRKADSLSAVTQTVEVASSSAARRARGKAKSRWTISPEGSVQRSFDSGKNWQTIPVASGVVFRVLSANDSDIWAGGAAGALYHSYDGGGHWIQIKAAANGKFLTSDIVSLEFSDASHGSLTTSDHEIWITADAGETWQRH